MPEIKIAVDAMGSDQAPAVEVEGAVRAAAEYGIAIVLVGQEDRIREHLQRHGVANLPIEIVHASEVITMEESAATAARKKKDSSIRVAARLMRDSGISGIVSAGNTGAVMATVKMVVGTLPVVDRPALSTVLPTQKGKPAILLDVGANVDCKPHHLEQFAIMGDIYSRAIFGIRRPRVGLLSIGEEDSKGNELTKEAFKSLKRAPINFIGNVEGRDIFKGDVDVIVCDGFTGNVALKLSEGLIETFSAMLRQELEKTLASKVGYIFSEKAFRAFRRRLDYSEYGGAPLLGINGITIVCHGRSNANAIKNAVRVANDFCKHHVNSAIETEFNKLGITRTAGVT
ncbi:MAG TPA: phosphate acyltransferase PlsX [Terriglobia bacterium]|nr:phosphate acyltransferase PlsX [Terriglobia bacterium]